MNALDERFGEGTTLDLVSTFSEFEGGELELDVRLHGPPDAIRILFEWTTEGEPFATGEIVWRTDLGEIVLVNLLVEEDFRGQGFYREIAGKWSWFRARGVDTFKAMVEDGSFLPAGGPWKKSREREWRWRLDD